MNATESLLPTLERIAIAQEHAAAAQERAATALERLADAKAPENAKVLCKRDRDRLHALVPVIAAVIRDVAFSVGELQAHASVDETLRAALTEAYGDISRASMLRLGKLFARATGFEVDGLHIRRLNRERRGVTWQIVTLVRRSS